MTAGRPPFDVAVIGLGPTGAVLANLCGRYGLRAVVFERAADAHPEPRAVHLDAEIARVLQQCGFGPRLGELLTPSRGMEFVTAATKHLFTFEGFEREPLLGWAEDHVFHQPDLDRTLRDGLRRFDEVDVRLGVTAPPLEELTGQARFVIACDGGSSGVRRELDIDLVDRGYDEEWLVVDLVVDRADDLSLPSIIQQVCDPDRLATYVPGHPPHHRFEFRVGPGEDLDPWALVAPWHITPATARLVRAARYRFHALVAERWRAGSVLLAGDAAHQMPPFMGQGLCSGVRDAANLAWKLAAVCRDGADEALLATYEAERRPHVEAVIDLSIGAGRLMATLADDVAAGRTPELPERASRDPQRWSRLPGLDLGAAFPVGHLLPQPVVDGWWFDDRLGLGWSVVTAADHPDVTYGEEAVLVRPDRYIAAAGTVDEVVAAGAPWHAERV